MDLLPKQMCHRCSYKLEEFHKFYVDCLKTDAALKSQLSWMRKGRGTERIGVPMVHIENVKIKAEPLDYDVYELDPLVENIDYINSMNSMAFPANDIHDGLTYAAFSRCQYCCDKQDQSRSRTRARTMELRQDYGKSLSKDSDTIAKDSRKNIFKDTTKDITRLRPVRRNVFSQAVFPDCPRNHLPHIDIIGDAQSRLTTTNLTDTKGNVSLTETRDHSYAKPNELSEDQATSTNTIAWNLRPRKNLVSYAPSKRKSLSVIQQPSMGNKSNIFDPDVTDANFELARQIKAEQVNEFEECSRLRPRRNIVDYQESRKRKGSEHRNVKKRKIDDMEQQRNERVSDIKIKQEVLDNLEDMALVKTTNARTRLQDKLAGIANLQAKIETPEIGDEICLREDMMPFKTKQLRSREKFLLTKKKSFSILRNKLAKTKKVNRFSTENYSLKYLRSQDTYLRNGKTKRNDYVEWSMKKLQTRKVLDAVNNKHTKEVPAILKLAESIKRYCEKCNISFMNTELFRLHACYYD
jgi:hypothetical protein